MQHANNGLTGSLRIGIGVPSGFSRTIYIVVDVNATKVVPIVQEWENEFDPLGFRG